MNKFIFGLILIASPICIGQEIWTIEDCIEHAIKHNSDIILQENIIKKNEQDIFIARGSFLPDLSLNVGQNFSLGNTFDVSTGIGQLASRSNDFRVTSTLNLFNGFQKKFRLKHSKLIQEEGLLNKERLIQEISLNVIDLYLKVIINREILKISLEQESISQLELQRLKKLYKSGLSLKNQILEMESINVLDKREIVLAENNMKNSLIRLQEVVGSENININTSNIDEIIFQSFNLSDSADLLYNKSLKKDASIRLIKLDSRIKEVELKISKSNFYPKIDLNYSFGSFFFHIQGEEDVIFNQQTQMFEENGFFTQLNNNAIHFVGINANVPIFSRFFNKANLKKVKLDLNTNKEILNFRKKELKNRISILINDLNSAYIEQQLSSKNLHIWKEAFDTITENYHKGNITNSEFIEGRSKYTQAQSFELRARSEYFLKTKYLNLILGEN